MGCHSCSRQQPLPPDTSNNHSTPYYHDVHQYQQELVHRHDQQSRRIWIHDQLQQGLSDLQIWKSHLCGSLREMQEESTQVQAVVAALWKLARKMRAAENSEFLVVKDRLS